MKKYTPSVKANHELKSEVVAEIKALVYRLEKGKFDPSLDRDTVAAAVARLKEQTENLENAIGTGEERVDLFAGEAGKQIKELKKQADQSLLNRFETAVDDLEYTVGLWKDVLDGTAIVETTEELAKEKVSRTRKKLNARLAELETIKSSFVENDKRLEKEIAGYEKDLTEYDNAILNEDNERKINDLYRQIKGVKSKIDMLSIRHSNYSACYNLLDMIYANAKEILTASNYAAEEISKAKVLLNIDRLKAVVLDPDKAVAILKRMEAEIKEIAARTAAMDSKVFGLESGATTVSGDALAYKEELMRKKREKEQLNNPDLSTEQTQKQEKTEETNNGTL